MKLEPIVVTSRTLCAVAIGGGATLAGPVIQIPRGAELRIGGHLRPDPRLVDVYWGAARYAVFEVDLRGPSA